MVKSYGVLVSSLGNLGFVASILRRNSVLSDRPSTVCGAEDIDVFLLFTHTVVGFPSLCKSFLYTASNLLLHGCYM